VAARSVQHTYLPHGSSLLSLQKFQFAPSVESYRSWKALHSAASSPVEFPVHAVRGASSTADAAAAANEGWARICRTKPPFMRVGTKLLASVGLLSPASGSETPPEALRALVSVGVGNGVAGFAPRNPGRGVLPQYVDGGFWAAVDSATTQSASPSAIRRLRIDLNLSSNSRLCRTRRRVNVNGVDVELEVLPI
jgi:hypothetical protein